MSGMEGFVHNCNENKVEKVEYRKTLRESKLASEECNLIWDFYVSRSFAAKTGNPIDLNVCGWKDTISKIDGYPALEKALADNAGILDFCIIRSKKLTDTRRALDLSNSRICVSHARAVMLQDYGVEANENEELKYTFVESRIKALFRHMRNSFAHGNTYFFDNNMVLLEDKDGGKITATILLPVHSLVDWIFIVDKNGNYYSRE